MDELDSEDSSDGALVIDEPQDEPKYDLHQITILENSDSDVEIIEIKDDDDDDEISQSSNNLLNSDSDVEIIEIKDFDGEISPPFDNLLNCVNNLNERLGNCINVSNVQQRGTKRKKFEDLTPELCIKNKRGSPPKLHNGFKYPLPQLIPINRPIILANAEPQDEKKIFNPQTEPKIYNPIPPPENNPENDLPSLSQILINEIEPEYPCTKCGQIFRHNIGLICHLNDVHNIITTVAEAKDKKKPNYTKVHERKKSTEKNVQLFRIMDELHSEDSSDGALVIDEPQDEPKYDLHQIKILENSDSDVEIIEIKDDDDDDEISQSSNNLLNSDSDVEIIEIKDFDGEISPPFDNLLSCAKNLNESLGNCINVSNVQQRGTKRNKFEDLTPELCIKNKRGSPPKLHNGFKYPLPQLIPINRPIILANTEPQDEKKIFNPQTEPKIYNPTPPPENNPENDLLPLSQILINEIEPEYPCTKCGQIFRHNIGLICHLNDVHNIITSVAEAKDKKKPNYTKVHKRKKSTEKKVHETKQIENDEPTVETINLTMLPDLKKDTLLSRMKSYVYSPNKIDVICVLCKAEFKNNKKALAHVEDKHISQKFQCGYCNTKFVYELKLRSHMAKRHKIICVLKCEKCAKMINREEYETHSETCTGQMNTINIKTEYCT